MTQERIKQAITILKYAIANKLSAKEACVKLGYGNTYIKNVKRLLIEKFNDNTISEDQYNSFMDVYYEYLSKKSPNEEIVNEYLTNYNDIKTNIELNKKVNKESIKVEDNKEDGTKTVTYTGSEPLGWKEENPNYKLHGYPKGHIKTLDQLLKRCKIDTTIWKVNDFLVNKWDVTSWKNGNLPQTWENFQVKAKLERIKDVYEGKTASEIFKELIEEYTVPQVSAKILPYNKHDEYLSNENNLLEIALFDLHIGKLAWAGETGENFDVKIAMQRFIKTLETLLHRANGFDYNKILFPIGNDFFNSDNLFNATTAGTPQDEDLRWQKTFKLGVKLIISAIDILKSTGVPVEVMIIPGNHDFEKSFYLGSVLEAWFNIDQQVKINNHASPRKYYKFGEVLLGFTHGKFEKESSLPMLMATEAKEDWGSSTFREWHLGHIHRKKNVNYALSVDKYETLTENNGIIVRYLSSLTGTEQWHHKMGFVGSIKAGEAFIWNDKTGMIGHLNANYVDFNKEH